MFGRDLHVILATATVVTVAGVAVEAAVRVATGHPPGRLSAVASSIVLVIVGMTAAGGLALLARDARPEEPLHFIYAALAFVLVPLGDSLGMHTTPRRRAVFRLVAAIATLGVIARLFATG